MSETGRQPDRQSDKKRQRERESDQSITNVNHKLSQIVSNTLVIDEK